MVLRKVKYTNTWIREWGGVGAPWWSTVAEMWGNDGGGTNTTSNLNNASNI
jgi:hypothetical protein